MTMKIGLFVVLLATMPVLAEEHNHGKDNIPDWYDSLCCHGLDCRPVEDEDIEFGTNSIGDFARYKPTGNVFYRGQFHRSQDERYHVCIHPNGLSLCFYNRPGT